MEVGESVGCNVAGFKDGLFVGDFDGIAVGFCDVDSIVGGFIVLALFV